jgi:hypothetical protein
MVCQLSRMFYDDLRIIINLSQKVQNDEFGLFVTKVCFH